MTNKPELKEAIELIRKKVIMTSHPEAKSYEEALELELGKDCAIDYMSERSGKVYRQEMLCYNSEDETFYLLGEGLPNYRYDIKRIIGKPLTLARVLNVLSLHKCIYELITDIGGTIEAWNEGFLFRWKFLNKDGSEATLQEQKPETILAISNLLGNDK